MGFGFARNMLRGPLHGSHQYCDKFEREHHLEASCTQNPLSSAQNSSRKNNFDTPKSEDFGSRDSHRWCLFNDRPSKLSLTQRPLAKENKEVDGDTDVDCEKF